MNSYILAIIFVACLAVGAKPIRFPPSVTREDVASLDKFLKSMPGNGYRAQDLALIEREADYLEGGAKRAAHAILALRDIKQCNQEVLSFLVHIEASALNGESDDDRSRKVSWPLSQKVGKICGKYIEQVIADERSQLASDEKVAKMFQVLIRAYKSIGYSFWAKPAEVIEKPGFWREFVDRNSAPIGANAARFDQFYQENITKPCEKITSGLGKSYKQAQLVALVQHNWFVFTDDRSRSFLDTVWAYKSCKKLLSLDYKITNGWFKEM